MTFLKPLLEYFKSKRPNSEVVEILHPNLDAYKGRGKNKKYLGNVCPLYVISTNKTDYDNLPYQDLVLYDSTGEGPIYSEKRYEISGDEHMDPQDWFNSVYKRVDCIKNKIGYLRATLIE